MFLLVKKVLVKTSSFCNKTKINNHHEESKWSRRPRADGRAGHELHNVSFACVWICARASKFGKL